MTFTFQTKHDHSSCISKALADAALICKARGQRFTKIRQLVLELVWQSHRPLGAYELLPAIKSAGFNSAPPTVYRALEFLQEQGLVHRISSLNAYIGCSHPGHQCSSCFLICDQCQLAVELESAKLATAIAEITQDMGFVVQREHLEIVGQCPNCQSVKGSVSADSGGESA
ncbi:Fur family transcriptional regulator ['Osedax' symbiont bacterium Rs2_46_30_T18]|nr:Fur family transcriptional regulator ['Osedax' symbiont bacterium Rs2_46_30_T18]